MSSNYFPVSYDTRTTKRIRISVKDNVTGESRILTLYPTLKANTESGGITTHYVSFDVHYSDSLTYAVSAPLEVSFSDIDNGVKTSQLGPLGGGIYTVLIKVHYVIDTIGDPIPNFQGAHQYFPSSGSTSQAYSTVSCVINVENIPSPAHDVTSEFIEIEEFSPVIPVVEPPRSATTAGEPFKSPVTSDSKIISQNFDPAIVPITFIAPYTTQQIYGFSNGSSNTILVLGIYPSSLTSSRARKLVNIAVPGREGDIIQDMGSTNMILTFTGKFLGASYLTENFRKAGSGESVMAARMDVSKSNRISILDEIEVLKKLFKSRTPIKIVTNRTQENNIINNIPITTGGTGSTKKFLNPTITKFLIKDFKFSEVGGRPNEVDFSVSLIELTTPVLKIAQKFIPTSSSDITGTLLEQALAESWSAWYKREFAERIKTVKNVAQIYDPDTGSITTVGYNPPNYMLEYEYDKLVKPGMWSLMKTLFSAPFELMSQQIVNIGSTVTGINLTLPKNNFFTAYPRWDSLPGTSSVLPDSSIHYKIPEGIIMFNSTFLGTFGDVKYSLANSEPEIISTKNSLSEKKVLRWNVKSQFNNKSFVGRPFITKEQMNSMKVQSQSDKLKDNFVGDFDKELQKFVDDEFRSNVNRGLSYWAIPYVGQETTLSDEQIETNQAIANVFISILTSMGWYNDPTYSPDIESVISKELFTLEHIELVIHTAKRRAMIILEDEGFGSIEEIEESISRVVN